MHHFVCLHSRLGGSLLRFLTFAASTSKGRTPSARLSWSNSIGRLAVIWEVIPEPSLIELNPNVLNHLTNHPNPSLFYYGQDAVIVATVTVR
jgi:hypothetical protein